MTSFPNCECHDRATEAQWQQLLRDRDAQAKLRQKEYADRRTSASHSNIDEGDQVLLRQARQNKLSPTYEPEPYRVIQRNGSAVIIENADGESKMRNVGHMKKFIQPEAATGKEAHQSPDLSLQHEPDPTLQDQLITASDPAEVCSPTLAQQPAGSLTPVPSPAAGSRPTRSTRPPI